MGTDSAANGGSVMTPAPRSMGSGLCDISYAATVCGRYIKHVLVEVVLQVLRSQTVSVSSQIVRREAPHSIIDRFEPVARILV